jgi:F-type H+-transporting ATPase subunit gamma
MTRLVEIEGHIAIMSELLDIVGAMRSLAAMRVQEAQRALPGIRRYADSVASAIAAALLLLPPPAAERGGGRALVLFLSEHGFVGGFNETLLAAAEAAMTPADSLFVAGTRGAAIAAERGLPAAWTQPVASRPAGAPDSANHLAAELYRGVVAGRIGRIEVMFARYRQGRAASVERHLLLPLDLEGLAARRSGLPPLHQLEPRALLEKLMEEYVFALLTEAVVESIASENGARFLAMESAHDNVGKKLEALHRAARQVRQSEITEELLDLITGAEAMRRHG